MFVYEYIWLTCKSWFFSRELWKGSEQEAGGQASVLPHQIILGITCPLNA